MVDTKRGYVGRCEERLAQQESGVVSLARPTQGGEGLVTPGAYEPPEGRWAISLAGFRAIRRTEQRVLHAKNRSISTIIARYNAVIQVVVSLLAYSQER